MTTGARLRLLGTATELAAAAGFLAAADDPPVPRVGVLLAHVEGLLVAARQQLELRPAHAAAQLQAARMTLGTVLALAFGGGVDLVGELEQGAELAGWSW